MAIYKGETLISERDGVLESSGTWTSEPLHDAVFVGNITTNKSAELADRFSFDVGETVRLWTRLELSNGLPSSDGSSSGSASEIGYFETTETLSSSTKWIYVDMGGPSGQGLALLRVIGTVEGYTGSNYLREVEVVYFRDGLAFGGGTDVDWASSTIDEPGLANNSTFEVWTSFAEFTGNYIKQGRRVYAWWSLEFHDGSTHEVRLGLSIENIPFTPISQSFRILENVFTSSAGQPPSGTSASYGTWTPYFGTIDGESTVIGVRSSEEFADLGVNDNLSLHGNFEFIVDE